VKALALSASLASKLASIVVHADEMMSPLGQGCDRIALEQAINDPEVKEWINALGPLAPVKRYEAEMEEKKP
jgi:hypothetical protein